MDDITSRELDDLTIHHQADIGRLWELLMQPLGFSGRSIWMTMIGADRRPVRAITEIAECGETLGTDGVDNLFLMLREVLRDHGHGASIALLLSRPGRHRVSPDDVRMARELLVGARRHDVPLEPIHVATDADVLPMAPDDLAA